MSADTMAAVMPRRDTFLRAADRDFGLLWAGQSVSLLGDQCMVVTLPLLTVGALGGSAAQAALLPFALHVPFLILGLPAGVILERFSRRAAMLFCNLVQMAMFGVVSIAAAAHVLTFPMLFVTTLSSGVAVVFFQVAYTSYMPCLYTDQDDIHRGNARLALSDSLSRAIGPALAGLLLGAAGAVGVVGINAISFALAAVTVLLMSRRETGVTRSAENGSLWREVGAGLRFVWAHPMLQPVMLCGTSYMFFLSVLEAALVLYCRQALGLSAALTGLVVGAAAAGYPIGNLLSCRMRRRLGIARALVATALLSVVGLIAMPVLGSLGGLAGAAGLALGSIVHSAGEGAYSPTSLTLRQVVTPEHLLRRVSAVQRFMLWGAIAMGGLVAAAIISVSSLTAAVWIGAAGTATCLPLLLRRGIRREFELGGQLALGAEP